MTVQAKVKMQTIGLIADVLQKTLPVETQAIIINCLLGCEYDDELSEDEGDAGATLFNCLCDFCGEEVVKMAQEM